MTFAYGTQMECIYSMGTAGTAASAIGAASAILSANATGNAPFQVNPFQSYWSSADMLGKGFKFVARGLYSTPASAPGTYLWGIGLNTTQATKPTAIVLASTPATTSITPPVSITNGFWEMELDVIVNVIGGSGGTPNMSLDVKGMFTLGNSPTAATTAATAYGIGQTSLLTTVNPTLAYWAELYCTMSTGPASSSIQCTQYQIYGLN
jgi:hypothetical protein